MGTAGSEADTDAASYADLNDDSETDFETELGSEVEQTDLNSEDEATDPSLGVEGLDPALEARQEDENRIERDCLDTTMEKGVEEQTEQPEKVEENENIEERDNLNTSLEKEINDDLKSLEESLNATPQRRMGQDIMNFIQV